MKSSFSAAGWEEVYKSLDHSLLHAVCCVHIFGAPKAPLYCFQKLVFVWLHVRIYIYIYNYIYIYIYICQDGGAVGFLEFTKLSFALSLLAQPFDQMVSVPEHVFVILSQRKAYAGRFQKETAEKRTGSRTKWPPQRLLLTRLEIVFIAISSFTKRTKVVPKVFQEDECCLEGLINLACGLQLQMLPKLNGHFMNVLVWFCT